MTRQNLSALPFSVSWVLDVLKTSLNLNATSQPRSEQQFFSSIQTDSRRVESGCLFVALKGETGDGHHHIEEAVRKGASGILCRQDYELQDLASKKGKTLFIPVPDTRDAYRLLAYAWRREFKIPVVAVAGSMGKTTTKDLIASLLCGKWENVLKTEASQNGFDGIPKTLLNLRPNHEIAVIEIGIDEPGAMTQHLDLVAPTHSILTAIGPEHLETLHDLETVAREECLALSQVNEQGGTIFINQDDPAIQSTLKTNLSEGTQYYYTFEMAEKKSTPAPKNPSATLEGHGGLLDKKIKVSGLGLQNAVFDLPISGRHNARNFMGAVCVAAGLGLNETEIKKGLQTFSPPLGRSEVIELAKDLLVVCDYYNASPPAMIAAFQTLEDHHSARKTKNHSWVCLADMLELGPKELDFHRSLAKDLILKRFDHVLLYGPRMKALHNELSRSPISKSVKYFEDKKDLIQALLGGVQKGDGILIKGSRGMKMEEVWKALQSHVSQ